MMQVEGRWLMDVYREPMLNVRDTAAYLGMPASTLGEWRKSELIHSVAAERQGWPVLPFAAVVEAFVLRSLRGLHFTRRQIVEAAAGIRRAQDDEYGLIRPEIVYDAADIFVKVGPELYRASDNQQAVRETVDGFKRLITWSDRDPQRLVLTDFGGVVLDPRFGWSSAVVSENNIPITAIVDLWQAGEFITDIADEYDMGAREVETLLQSWQRAQGAAA